MSKSLLLLVICLSGAAFAQKPNSSFFSVESGEKTELKLSDVETDVEIKGAFADTTLDLAYFNKNSSALQGLFKIQLPQGALVRDFALKINDQWHLGSLVEKHKARTTFEEIVRAGQDPAVLAWKDGAEYQVRIFPFPANGKRWIRIRYWQDLSEVKEQFAYRLPLPKGLILDSFKLKLNVQADSMESIEIAKPFSSLAYIKSLNPEKQSFGAIVDEKKFTLPGELSLQVGHKKNSKAKVWSAFTAPKGDLVSMAARWFEDLPQKERKLAKKTLIFLDTSRSSEVENLKETLASLEKFTDEIAKKSNVQFFEFDAAVKPVDKFKANSITFDGGTNFQAVIETIKREQMAFKEDVDVILVTDALPTMQKGSELLKSSLSQVRLYLVPSSRKFSKLFAQAWTEQNHGTLLDNPAEWLKAYKQSLWHFVGLTVVGGTATDVYPEPDTRVDTTEGLGVYFRTKNSKRPTSGIAKFSDGDQVVELTVDFSKATENPNVEFLWAMKKLSALIPQSEDYGKELAAHATRYGLVSPLTSYIVLESNADYQRFNITKREGNPNLPEPILGFGSGGDDSDAAMEMDAVASDSPAAPPPPADSSRVSSEIESVPQRKRVESVNTQPGSENLVGAIDWKKAIAKYTSKSVSLKELLTQYKKTNTSEVKDPWYFVEYAQSFSELGDKAHAFRVLSNLFEISEEDGKSLRTLGLLGCFQAQCEWAEKALEMAIELRPEEPQNYRDLAWFHVERGQFKKAYETILRLKDMKFHTRFPGMDVLIEKETAWLKALSNGKNSKQDFPSSYSWITWNNDNNDVDFWIKESTESLVSYMRKSGIGELSSDFTRGYGPEVYFLNNKKIKPQFFVSYYSQDQTTESMSVIVKMTTIEGFENGKPRFTSRLIPLYESKKMVQIN